MGTWTITGPHGHTVKVSVRGDGNWERMSREEKTRHVRKVMEAHARMRHGGGVMHARHMHKFKTGVPQLGKKLFHF